VLDKGRWEEAKLYVDDFMSRFRDDRRILGWDIYNEPGNGGMAERSVPFMREAARWARSNSPIQPITVGVWQSHRDEFTEMMWSEAVQISDFLSFHCYLGPNEMEELILRLKPEARPIVCTEWLHRPRGNLFANMLPIFERYGVGHQHWGLVAGQTQTNLLWSYDIGVHPDTYWLADVLREDGTPYDPSECALLRDHVERVINRIEKA
jgi:hypothetical protein